MAAGLSVVVGTEETQRNICIPVLKFRSMFSYMQYVPVNKCEFHFGVFKYQRHVH